MRALSIRQPYAELILRGEKRIEFRSKPTKIIGERFLIYASQQVAKPQRGTIWSSDLSTTTKPPKWMLELARGLGLGELPRGVIVGSAMITHVTRGGHGMYEWHLDAVERDDTNRKPTGRPQPVWFNAFVD